MVPDNFKKFLLNRVTASKEVVDFLENARKTEDDLSKYSFHKVMIHNWSSSKELLFDSLSKYFVVSFIPINFVTKDGTSTFYTSSLNFILKVIMFEFLFLYNRSMLNIDILLCDKTSHDLFGSHELSVLDIIGRIVNSRFTSHLELDLSNFKNDPEIIKYKIEFYQLSLLSIFKILMVRLGGNTRYLNLSHNNLSIVPLTILNFFIKGDLIGIDLRNNNISSMDHLHRVSSKIVKLHLEYNPLCKNKDPIDYIKDILLKFPRLKELDGVPLDKYGAMVPFYKSYVVTPDKKTQKFVEQFVNLYFSHYDSRRTKLLNFYGENAQLTISTPTVEVDGRSLDSKLTNFSRNVLSMNKNKRNHTERLYSTNKAIVALLIKLPPTVHDTSSFTIDVVHNDGKLIILIIGGIYKELGKQNMQTYLSFRRTIFFEATDDDQFTDYFITREMFTTSCASEEMKRNTFLLPIRNQSQLTLIDPDWQEQNTICKAFSYYTQLKIDEVERRLNNHDWDIRMALKEFMNDFRKNSISTSLFDTESDYVTTDQLMDEVD
ncbi:nuclear RNA export factor 1-like isoform X2 [Leptidea sinapis]|nr:nuclear RNA export factor 1-like isoform X2 [Leptidea sinapis]